MKLQILLGAFTLALAGAALGAETTTYEYDAQGRLIKSAKSGGPASGTQKCTSFDAAGNRTNQTVNSSGCTGSSGGGGGSNSPPVAVDDLVLAVGNTATKNVVANDTDPDGDTLTVISASGPGVSVTISGGTTLNVTGVFADVFVTYTVSDGNGGTDTGVLSVIAGSCGPFCF